METGLYKLRFEQIRACNPSPRAAATARVWMGVEIRALAKVSELFVTPRDFALEREGIILPARHVHPPNLRGCSPLLPAAQLRAQQSVRGFVLFEVPARFRTGDVPIVLSYRPTRWGGAGRVELRIPACLDVCPKDEARERATVPRGR